MVITETKTSNLFTESTFRNLSFYQHSSSKKKEVIVHEVGMKGQDTSLWNVKVLLTSASNHTSKTAVSSKTDSTHSMHVFKLYGLRASSGDTVSQKSTLSDPYSSCLFCSILHIAHIPEGDLTLRSSMSLG